MDFDDGEQVVIYRSTSESECRQNSLALQAVGTAHRILRGVDGYAISVAAADAIRSRGELEALAAENRGWQHTEPAIRDSGDGWNGVLGFIAVLSLMAVMQKRQVLGLDWFAAGRTQAGLIRAGEWWRTVTALTLHIDLEHVLSNMTIGGLVGLFAGRVLGSGFAWLGTLLGGALGNFANALIRPAEHSSVGASTAVFAALGLLASVAWQQRRERRSSWLERWAPIVGSVLLLSLLGTGGERTDVGAHVFGFVCAVPLGVWYGRVRPRWADSQRAQSYAAVAALALVALSWEIALRR